MEVINYAYEKLVDNIYGMRKEFVEFLARLEDQYATKLMDEADYKLYSGRVNAYIENLDKTIVLLSDLGSAIERDDQEKMYTLSSVINNSVTMIKDDALALHQSILTGEALSKEEKDSLH